MGLHKKTRSEHKDFIGFLKSLLDDPEWLALPSCAMLAYIYIKKEFNGHNNGQVIAPYKSLKKVLKSSATISKAIKILERGGWIETTKQGGLFQRASTYRITFSKDIFGKQKW